MYMVNQNSSDVTNSEIRGFVEFSSLYGPQIIHLPFVGMQPNEIVTCESFRLNFIAKDSKVPTGAFELNGIQCCLTQNGKWVELDGKIEKSNNSVCNESRWKNNVRKPFEKRGVLYLWTVNGWVDIVDTDGWKRVKERYDDWKSERDETWRIMWTVCSYLGISKADVVKLFGGRVKFENMIDFTSILLQLNHVKVPKSKLKEAIRDVHSYDHVNVLLKTYGINIVNKNIGYLAIKAFIGDI